MSKVPYIGFSNRTLDKLPVAVAGQVIDCPTCKAQHELTPAATQSTTLKVPPGGLPTAAGPSETMFYKCGTETRLGAVGGRLVIGVKPDVSSSRKTHHHASCEFCWRKREGAGRDPIRLKDAPSELCCFCGQTTRVGIYILAHDDDPRPKYCSEMRLAD